MLRENLRKTVADQLQHCRILQPMGMEGHKGRQK